MFTKLSTETDILLSNEAVTNLVVSDALKKISQITGLSEQQAFALLLAKVNQQHSNSSQHDLIKVQSPLIEQKESQFISSLFN